MEVKSSVDYKKLKSTILAAIKEDWGPRCETWDYEDFPEMKGLESGRCPVCLVYEKFDAFWEQLDFERQVPNNV